MKTIMELANDLADLRVMAARGQCVTSDEVADAYKALEKAIAAARVAALEEAAKICDVTPVQPFRPSIEAAWAIRALIGGNRGL